MVRTTAAALMFAAVLSIRAEGQAPAGPRLQAFVSLPAFQTPLVLRRGALGDTQHPAAAPGRGRTFLTHTGLGLLIGAATGALVGPVLTNSACLSWKKDATHQVTCLDAFFTPREHLKSAVVLGGIGAVVGAVASLIARTAP